MNSPTNEELINHAGFAKWKVSCTLQCSPLNNSGSVKVYVGIASPNQKMYCHPVGGSLYFAPQNTCQVHPSGVLFVTFFWGLKSDIQIWAISSGHDWKKLVLGLYGFCVGKYTSPMDATGYMYHNNYCSH